MHGLSRSGKIEESAGEGIHRDVTQIRRLASSASVWHWSAQMKLKMNFDFFDRCCTMGRRQEFYKCFANWKSIGQINVRKYEKNVRKLQSTKAMLEFVYRAGAECLVDFGSLAKHVQQDNCCATVGTQLKIEYIKTVLDNPKSIFTLPKDVDTREVESCTTLADAAAKAEDTCQSYFAFRVINADPRKKKLHGNVDEIFRGMEVPMIIQVYENWGVDRYPAQEHSLVCTGEPDIKNVLSLATWPVMQSSLREWKVTGRVFAHTLDNIMHWINRYRSISIKKLFMHKNL